MDFPTSPTPAAKATRPMGRGMPYSGGSDFESHPVSAAHVSQMGNATQFSGHASSNVASGPTNYAGKHAAPVPPKSHAYAYNASQDISDSVGASKKKPYSGQHRTPPPPDPTKFPKQVAGPAVNKRASGQEFPPRVNPKSPMPRAANQFPSYKTFRPKQKTEFRPMMHLAAKHAGNLGKILMQITH